jgi:hypothetical protein
VIFLSSVRSGIFVETGNKKSQAPSGRHILEIFRCRFANKWFAEYAAPTELENLFWLVSTKMSHLRRWGGESQRCELFWQKRRAKDAKRAKDFLATDETQIEHG